MYGSQWGSLVAACSCIFYYKSRENLYQVLQVTCMCLNVQGTYDKITN